MIALGKEMQIERPEDDAEGIRIALRPLVPVVRGEMQLVVKALRVRSDDRLEKAVSCSRSAGNFFPSLKRATLDGAGIGTKNADDELLAGLMHAEHRKRVAVIRAEQRVDVAAVESLRDVEDFM